jgi:hypothetical protein
MRGILCLGLLTVAIAANPVSASAQCPSELRLRGSDINKLWKQVTNTAWGKMLPDTWADKGFHFYSQARLRGPDAGINTPSDFEDEVMKKVRDEPEGTPNRRQIILPIQNSKGQNLRVIYDFDGRKKSKCELVTLSY